jgi:hypothetical protein
LEAVSYVDSHNLPCEECRAKLADLGVVVIFASEQLVAGADHAWSLPVRMMLTSNNDGTAELAMQALSAVEIAERGGEEGW